MRFDYRLMTIAEDDPYPLYRRMRDDDPAHYSEVEDVWVISRFGDVSRAFRDWHTWSSQRRGNLLHDMPERIGRTLGTTDPPAHTYARGLVDKAFTTRVVDELKPKIAGVARSLVDEARAHQPIEFVSDISAPLNAAILGSMFGVPDSDFIQLRHWLDDFFLREDARPGQEPPQDVAMRALREYVGGLAQERLRHPSSDLMTAMLVAEEDGRRLDVEQVIMTTMTFLTAGFESANNLFTNLTQALAIHPDVWRELRSDPGMIPAFVEEGMRWDAPAQGFVRTPTRAVGLHGKTIPEGAQVLLHIGSANRDERVFSDPDRLDIHRPKQRHLGMGLGIHFCVGAPLGRAMAQLVFTELVEASSRWETDLSGARRVRTPNFRGFSRLPLCI